jgi:Tfp pilus assembly protein PilZ
MTVRIDVEYEACGGETRTDVATTLGAGGLFVATQDPLDDGTTLVTRFCLPDGTTQYEISARVVWNHRKGDAGRPDQTPGMGICFTDPAQGAVLAAELESMIAQAEIEERRRRQL